MSTIRVLIADDHPIVCRGIRNLLDAAVGIEVVGEVATGTAALEMIETLEPDVLLLDMELPDLKGVEVLRRVNQGRSRVRILGLSSYDDREYISQLLALGAAGYLIKDEVPETIIEAVRGVARGESGWISRRVAARLSHILQREQEGGKDFTPRELDVLRLMAEGKTNSGIGLALGISVKTVEKHLDAIFRKMGVASRVEAAVMAIRENYV